MTVSQHVPLAKVPGKVTDATPEKEDFSSVSFKPGDRGFDGAGAGGGEAAGEGGGGRGRPVEFEKEDEDDPFGLDELLSQAKKSKP